MTSIITKGVVTNGGIDRLRKVIGGGGCIADNVLSCVREGGVGGDSSCCFSFRQDRECQFQYFLFYYLFLKYFSYGEIRIYPITKFRKRLFSPFVYFVH